MDTRTALTRLGGFAGTAELRHCVSAREIARSLAAGEVLRAARGTYALPGSDASRSAARQVNGVTSHLSAAQRWGWRVRALPPTPVVTVPRGRTLTATRRQGVDVRWADLPEDDVSDGPDRVTTRLRTVLDCARTLPFAEALCVADSALREGRVDVGSLRAGVQDLPRTGRSRARGVVAAADAGAANPFESVLRALALDVPGLHVATQVQVTSVFRADLADARLKIVVEAESFECHALREAFSADVRRYTAMTALGWLVARFTYDDVMHRPEHVRRVLADLVRQRTRR